MRAKIPTIGLALAAALAFLLPAGLSARAAEPTFDTGMIPPGHIFLPEGEPGANIFLISDAGGWGDGEESLAKKLSGDGATVVGIDFPAYLKALAADKGDCVYMISDVEALSQQMQRAGGAKTYNPPIVAGIGEGGALALAMISQSPKATVGEAIAVDPLAGIPLDRELCTPAKKTRQGNRTVYDMTDGPLPAAVTVILTKNAPADGRSHAEALHAAHAAIALRNDDGTALDSLSQALSDRVDAAGDDGRTLGLPLTLLETAPTRDTMAVIYSGDGGWRDIDSQVGGVLQSKGIPVVGVDSLRYFWSARDPQETADDLSRIIDTYSRQWKVGHVLLIGYSFGADILPGTFNRLPEDARARVSQITLMALSHRADYEISVEGWLGGGGKANAGDPVTDIARIDPARIQCIYGKDEEEDACPTLAGSGVELIGIDGGHHFDGDYAALTDRIVAGLEKRLKN
ncbi:virulence factor family protein [Gellertiella hungarica]|uniref:Type IV secretory pathway VirJ component n=1 Tax=Gellertiella hungarica TaxID=1572859 RepID=A0A7W6J8B9_9HYPH|nr:virulence factor family protein [Gellertiella hungarica]MBB4066660.1 type IV secretory pathway VirJ component [Gellertiella hungarica]